MGTWVANLKKVKVLMSVALLEYNAFGLVSISPKAVTASVNAVAGGRLISRSVRHEGEIAGLERDEQSAIVFGAWLEPGQKPRITLHQVGSLRSGLAANEIPEVGKVLTEAIELVMSAAES